MNKKQYLVPAAEMQEYLVESELLTVSSDDYGIEYGGVDDGSNEPAARMLEDIL